MDDEEEPVDREQDRDRLGYVERISVNFKRLSGLKARLWWALTGKCR